MTRAMAASAPWASHSDPRRQTLLAVGTVFVGIVLAWGCRGASFSAFSNETAGLLLGALLLVVGIGGFLARGRQTVTVHPGTRLINNDASRGSCCLP